MKRAVSSFSIMLFSRAIGLQVSYTELTDPHTNQPNNQRTN